MKCIDVWSAIQKRDDWLTSCFTLVVIVHRGGSSLILFEWIESVVCGYFRDGIHFTAEGSQIVAEEICKVLEEADWEPSLHWKELPIEFGSPTKPSSPVRQW